jgi:hypothetical protein
MPKNPLCIYHANCADGFGAERDRPEHGIEW